MTADLAGTTLVVRPGDHVLVALRDLSSNESVARLKEMLCARFPGVEFSLVTGVQALAVMPAEPVASQPEPDAVTALRADLHRRLAEGHRFVRIGEIFEHLAPALEVTTPPDPKAAP